jgi:glyoxylase-like metal-dependent hydrolase (beta-lactamase superfamily II)
VIATASCSSAAPEVTPIAAPGNDLVVTELGDGLINVTSEPFAANSLLVRTPDGAAILIDTPTTPADTAALLDWIEARWKTRVRWAINSHWHADASGGNQVLIARGAEVISSTRTAQMLRTRGASMGATLRQMFAGTGARGDAIARELESFRPTPATRQLEIQGAVSLELGGEVVELINPGPSHSADSIGVYLPRSRVLYGGCAVRSDGSIGNRDEASPNWPTALEAFAARAPTIVIPGHGRRFDPEMLDESIAAARALFATPRR